MKLASKILFSKKVLKKNVVSCGPCGDGVGYSLPGPVGCTS